MWFCWIAKLRRKTTKSETPGLCSKTRDLYDHILHLGSVWQYFPTFSVKRASKVSAGVSLWRHFWWQMIIRYFYSAEMIFLAFPSLQAELWSATLSDSASHLPAFKTPQFSYLLTFFLKSLTTSEKKSYPVVLASSFLQQSCRCLQRNLCPRRHCRKPVGFLPSQQDQLDAGDAPRIGLGKAVGPSTSAGPSPGEKPRARWVRELAKELFGLSVFPNFIIKSLEVAVAIHPPLHAETDQPAWNVPGITAGLQSVGGGAGFPAFMPSILAPM